LGTPDPAFSFGRILETQLRLKYPERNIEVLNAAMRGINSYVIRTIAVECSEHQVDAFIIYLGNNEVNGLHAPEPGSSAWTQCLPLLRSSDWARATRLGQLFLTLTRHTSTRPEKQDMAPFRKYRLPADGPRRTKVLENFHVHLDDICRIATRAGAKVMTSTPPFVDQLDRATRQADAEADIQKRLAAFSPTDAESCVKIHEAVLQHHPQDWPVRFNLASLLLELGRASEAARNLKIIVDQFPERVKFRLALAAALVKAGDPADALRQLEAARRIDPADNEVGRAIKALQTK
jgi:tetratricopeptide (TPR) repeat protein